MDLDDAGGTGSLLHAEALRSTLAVVTPALERLLDSRASGRGGAVFAALRGPELICLATPMCRTSRVVFDSRPFVRPLLELLDEGEPAGVVLTSVHEAEVLDWRPRALRRLFEVVFPLNEGRAEHVMYDSALRCGGAVAADGSLPAAGEAPGLGRKSRGSRSPFPGAHSTPARVSRAVDGSAAGKLADAGGIRRCCAGDRGEGLVSILIWVIVGLAIWHFAVLVPDPCWGGVIGAFLAALLGAMASGYLLPAPGIPVDNPPGWSEGPVAGPGLAPRAERVLLLRGSARALGGWGRSLSAHSSVCRVGLIATQQRPGPGSTGPLRQHGGSRASIRAG